MDSSLAHRKLESLQALTFYKDETIMLREKHNLFNLDSDFMKIGGDFVVLKVYRKGILRLIS